MAAVAPFPVGPEPEIRWPHSLDAERAVLGVLLMRPQAWAEVADLLAVEDFYREAHRRIYDVVLTLGRRGDAVDVITVKQELERRHWLEEVGGASYLASLYDGLPKSTHVQQYCDLVREKAQLRGLLQIGRALAAAASQEADTPSALIAAHESALRSLTGKGALGKVYDGTALAELVLDRLARVAEHGRAVGLQTGFTELDHLTTGLQPGELIVCAGRPSMGKTSFMSAIAWHVATQPGQHVFVITVEMTAEDIALRNTSLDANLNFQKLRTYPLSDSETPRVMQTVAKMETSGLHVDETARTVPDIRRQARILAANHGLSLIVIDYLQILQPVVIRGRRAAENRTRELAEMTADLKALAKELRVPVLLLSQLSRDCERRADKRPILADLRESGAIEQDADQVWFLFRPEVYESRPELAGQAEVIVAKQRNGPTGTVPLYWNGSTMRFYERETRA